MAIDGMLVTTGMLLGGLVGIGTIFCILLTGPIIEFSLKLFTFLRSRATQP